MRSTFVTSHSVDPLQGYLWLQANMRASFEQEPLKVTYDSEGGMIMEPKQLQRLDSVVDDLNSSFQCHLSDPKPWVRQSTEESMNLLKEVQNIIDILRKIQENRASVYVLIQIRSFLLKAPEVGNKIKDWKLEWCQLLSSVLKEQNLMTLAKDQGFLRTLYDLLQELESIKAKFQEFLENTRTKAPRLYLFSDDQVIKLLRLHENPAQLQNSILISKIFIGVQSLQISEEGNIDRVNSYHGEKFDLARTVNIKELELVDLLNELRNSLSDAVRKESIQAIKKVGSLSVQDYINELSFQGILFASQVIFTHEGQVALTTNKIKQFKEKLANEHAKLAKLVVGKISTRERVTYESLILDIVHRKDIMSILGEEDISQGVETFRWLLQTRLYQQQNGDAELRVGKASIPCDFQYMGPEERPAITPLTERFQLTVSTALSLNMIFSAQGPAGCGKDTMVLDMASILRRYYFQIACSDKFDRYFLAKRLIGACSQGSWLIFSEFNRVSIQELRFFGMYMSEVRDALMSRKELNFNGIQFNVVPTFGCFLTMNPGYAGRTEIPQNLRKITRPMAVVAPNFQIIALMKLYAVGFENATSLAQRVCNVFKAFHQTLSKQDHYDWGMRALKTLIGVAAKLKQEAPNEDEEKIMVKAFNHIFYRLLPDDAQICQRMVKSDFPLQDTALMTQYQELESVFAEKIRKFMRLNLNKTQVKTACGLKQVLEIRHSVITLGGPLSGKTTAIQAVAWVIGDVKMSRINTKKYTAQQFYGWFNDDNEWTDGVFTKQLREYSFDKDGRMNCIVLDGPIDALLVEDLHSLMDEYKRLHLANGQIIQVPPNFRLIFEVESLAVVSPATISRNCIIHFSEKNIEWRDLFTHFVDKFQGKEQKELQDAKESLEKIIEFLKVTKTTVPLNENQLVRSFLRLLQAQLKEATSMTKSVAFAAIWSFGGAIVPESRIAFDELMKCLPLADQAEVPRSEFLYDLALVREMGTDKWVRWEQLPGLESDDLISNSQTLAQLHLMSLYAANSIPFLLVGPSATGKSASADALLSRFSSSKQMIKYVCQKGTTRANIKTILQKSEASDDERFLVYLEDIDLVQREVYGAIPAIQFIRQFLFTQRTQRVNVMCSINPQSKGRAPLSTRFLTYFNIISFPDYSECSLERILQSLCSNPKLVSATIELYKEAKLRFPSASWNLRDLKKILSLVGQAKSTGKNSYRIWAHQCFHIFGDRLVSKKKEELSNLVCQISQDYLETTLSSTELKGLIWSALGPRHQVSSSFYSNPSSLRREILNKVTELNQMRSNPIDLHLHNDNLTHILSLVRALRCSSGNTLLLTRQPSDAEKIARLAMEITGVREVQAKQDFSATFKEALIQAGRDENETVLLISEEMAQNKRILQTVNTFLGSGFSDQVFSQKELEDLSLSQGLENLKANCREHLHLVVIRNISQQSDYLEYSGLMETTFVDLYEALSPDSLSYLVQEALSGLNLPLQVKKEIIGMCLETIRVASQFSREEESGNVSDCDIYQFLKCFTSDYRTKQIELNESLSNLRCISEAVEVISYKDLAPSTIKAEEGLKEIGHSLKKGSTQIRKLVTPSLSDLTELKMYAAPPQLVKDVIQAVYILLGEKNATWKDFLAAARKPLELLQRIAQIDPKEITPRMLEKLQEKTSDPDFRIEDVRRKSAATASFCEWVLRMEELVLEAGVKLPQRKKKEEFSPYEKIAPEEETKQVKMSEFERDELQASLTVKKEECERAEKDLREAEPIWREAQKATEGLKIESLNEIRMFNKPPEIMKRVMEALCILMRVAPERKLSLTNAVQYEYWGPSLKLLANKSKILQLNTDELREKDVEEVEKRFSQPELELDKIKAVSLPASDLAKWIKAILALFRVNQHIAPKRALFKEKRREVQELEKLLREGPEGESKAEELKSPLEQLEEDDIPQPPRKAPTREEESGYLESSLSSGMATIEMRISDVEQSLRRLPMLSLQSVAHFVFGSKLRASERQRMSQELLKITNTRPKGQDTNNFNLEKWAEQCNSFGKTGLILDSEGIAKQQIRSCPQLKDKVASGADYSLMKNNSAFFIVDPSTNQLKEIMAEQNSSSNQPTLAILNFQVCGEDLVDILFEELLELENPELKLRLKFFSGELEDQRVRQIASEKKLIDIIESLQTSPLSKIMYDLNTVQEIYSRIKALELKRSEVIGSINSIEKAFAPLIDQVGRIFKCLSKIRKLDPAYVFTFSKFIKLFKDTVTATAVFSSQAEDRVHFLQRQFLNRVHTWVCRGLRESDRFLFTLMLGVTLSGKALESKESEFLFHHPSSSRVPQASPIEWLSDESWTQVCDLSELPSFKGLNKSFKDNEKAWLKIFEKDEPHEYKLPGVWRQKLDEFQFLLVLRAVKPDKLGVAIKDYIANLFGDKFLEDMMTLSPKDLHKESDCKSPILIISETDIGSRIKDYALSLGKKVEFIEMGSFESMKFDSIVEEAAQSGKWVILNKIHLAYQFQTEIMSSIRFLKNPHRSFKLWITTAQTELLPRSLNQVSLRFFVSPPKSMKEALLELLQLPVFSNQSRFNEASEETRSLIISVLFIHASLCLRRKYQTDTSKIYYKYRVEELESCIQMLEQLSQKTSVSYLTNLVSRVIYGGVVGDENDKKLLQSISTPLLQQCLRKEPLVLLGKFAPPTTTLQALHDYIASLPDEDTASTFGFSQIEEKIYQEKKSIELMRKAAELLYPRKPKTEQVISIVKHLLESLPQDIVVNSSIEAGVDYFQQALHSEAKCYNKFFKLVKNSLSEIVKSHQQSIPFTSQSLQIISNLAEGTVPQMWMRIGIASNMGIYEYLQFMGKAAEFFNKWSNEGQPPVFNLSYFFVPQKIFYAVSMTYALQSSIPTSTVKLSFKILPERSSQGIAHSEYEIIDKIGSIKITGLYLARAHFDTSQNTIVEKQQGAPLEAIPVMDVIPNNENKELTLQYECPLYRTSLHGLGIMGRPQNYIWEVSLPSKEDPKKWIEKGVALFLSAKM